MVILRVVILALCVVVGVLVYMQIKNVDDTALAGDAMPVNLAYTADVGELYQPDEKMGFWAKVSRSPSKNSADKDQIATASRDLGRLKSHFRSAPEGD